MPRSRVRKHFSSSCLRETTCHFSPQRLPIRTTAASANGLVGRRRRLDRGLVHTLRCTAVQASGQSGRLGPTISPEPTETPVTITLNGERRDVPDSISVASLLVELGVKPEHVAVERNRDLVPRTRHAEAMIEADDVVEVVTLVGGGSPEADQAPFLTIGPHRFRSRLLVGTGKYSSMDVMRDCLDASGTEVVTVAVRRERLFDKEGRNILDFLDPARYTILPNTAGCFTAEDALRTARLGRELLSGLGNPGADWVKLEVLAETRTLLPDPVATLKATEILVAEGFHVLCYTSDDPVMARYLKAAGAASVMPAGSPIGSGHGSLERQQPADHPRGSQG